jgi:hypothetical protein
VAYCTNCGTQENEGQRFCAVCGAPRGDAAQAPMPSMSSGHYSDDAHVRIGIAMEPPFQSRWSILFRLVLALPLVVVLASVGFVATFAAIGAWFTSLFTGRVTDGLQEFLTGFLRLAANVAAYALLLTPRWPGVSFREKSTDQVTIAIDHVGLRRWSVFFRLFLAIPANIVGSALQIGSIPFLVAMWIWGIVTGREPKALHQALALVLRYELRFQAYTYMLSPTQPFAGLFGDGEEKNAAPTNASVVAASAVPSLSNNAAPLGALPVRWFVARATKVVVVLIIVVSIPMYVVARWAEAPEINQLESLFAGPLVTVTYNESANAVAQMQAQARACTAANNLTCVSRAASTAYPLLTAQSSLLANNSFIPTNALARAKKYEHALDNLESVVFEIQNPPSLSSQKKALDTALPSALATFSHEYRSLERRLHR